MTLPTVPFEKAYWAAKNLLVGPAPYVPGDASLTAARIKALIGTGVQGVVSLLAHEELALMPGLAALYDPWLFGEEQPLAIHYSFRVRNGATPSVARMSAILNAIDAAHAQCQTVYLHCIGGRGRTATALGCWFARHEIATGEAALHLIACLRKVYGLPDADSPETRSQCRRVSTWEVGA